MAVEHTMAGLNTTWWDLLKEIASKLNCTYGALWTQTDDGRRLIWKVGYFHMLSNDDANGELFHSLYSTCTFTTGVGFAGHALASNSDILWLSGAQLDSLEYPVNEQTFFVKTAGIQTVVCLSLGLPSNYFVLELGTVRQVCETEEWGRYMKSYLLGLRARGLLHLLKGSSGTNFAAVEPTYGQVQTGSNESSSSLATESETPLELIRPAAAPNFSASGFGEELLLKAQRELQSNIYSELMQPIEREESFGGQQMHATRRLSNIIPHLVLDIPDLPESSEPRPGEVFESGWETDTSLLPMELNSFQSWTSMADATSTLEVAIPAVPGTSSGRSSRPVGELVDLNDKTDQMLPFPSGTLDQFMRAAAGHGQQQQQLMEVRRDSESPSRSSMSLRSQTMEDSAISSAILESYADCHISDIDEARPRVRADNVEHNITGVSSNTTLATVPAELESMGGAQQSSSSKETSPDTNVPPPPPFGHGIHPRISSTTRLSQKQLQAQLLARTSSASGGTSFTRSGSGSGSGGSSPPMRSHELDRQYSGPLRPHRQQQEDDLRQAAPSGEADSAPRLVQFGNVLQLGNSAGQVTEALPQEHDEAAVSHMLAERRRRNRQNENFSQLKFLIPAAAKMDKATLLAATISYIHELKKRVQDLEQDNQNLKSQLLGHDKDQSQSSSEGFLASVGAKEKGKGSPIHFRVRSPTSPPDVDKVHVVPDGDGNLLIEIRSACSQPDGALLHIFACLKEMHFKIIIFNVVALNDSRIQANITTKMKRKNSAGQREVCAEVEQTLLACLKNLA